MPRLIKKSNILIITSVVLSLFIILTSVKRFQEENLEENYLKILNNKYYPSNSLFDILNFTYVIKPTEGYCKNVTVIFITTSFYQNVELRSIIRKVSLNELNTKRIFLLGIGPDNEYINQKALRNEALRFGDIVQGNFIEAYRNLTYKHIMGLKWISENCGTAEFVIKMDDDIVANINGVLKFLKTLPRVTGMYGYMMRDLKVRRQRQNKWFVRKREYGKETYPIFLSGWFYITTPDVCQKLETQSRTTEYFWIDDVYVTGILAESLNIKRYDVSRIFAKHSEILECCMEDVKKKKINCDVLIGPNDGKNGLFYEFNDALKTCDNSCKNRTVPIAMPCKERKLKMGISNIVKTRL